MRGTTDDKRTRKNEKKKQYWQQNKTKRNEITLQQEICQISPAVTFWDIETKIYSILAVECLVQTVMKKNGTIKSHRNLDKREKKTSAFVFSCVCVCVCIKICLHSILLLCRCFWFSQWRADTSDSFIFTPAKGKGKRKRKTHKLRNNWLIGRFAKGSHRFFYLIYCLSMRCLLV